jgi:translocator protein
LSIGGYRLLRSSACSARNRALGWWALNVATIGGWSGIFFARRNLPASTAVAAAMVGTGIAYVAEAQRVDKPAAAAGLPYVAWVAFATVLTAAIWRRNR